MKGILSKTKNGWVVNYQETFNNGMLPVHPDSLSNPDLSTYWVPGKEVEFNIVEFNMLPHALIESPFNFMCEDPDCPHCKYEISEMEDDEWEDILEEICEQDLNNIGDIFQWLKENYHPPKLRV